MSAELLSQIKDDEKLARLHCPTLYFDDREPFLPKSTGYTVYRNSAVSCSAQQHTVELANNEIAIEYAVWYIWDIQHLYELEHIWIYIDSENTVQRVEASHHGFVSTMLTESNELPITHGKVSLYAQPGKHAMSIGKESLFYTFAQTSKACQSHAGVQTILVTDMFASQLQGLRAYDHHLARNYLQSNAFTPSFRFNQHVDLATTTLMPWETLKKDIPRQIHAQLTHLRNQAKGVKAVFLDSGDTLIDESSQVFEGNQVLHAHAIPGGEQLAEKLKEKGYLVALVADGLIQNFQRVHKALGFWQFFDARVISEQTGVEKPHPLMFSTAARQLGLTANDYAGCVMVGNNLERDIAGANRLGMCSVWLNWTTRYPTTPANNDEIPDYTITEPLQLLELLEQIDNEHTKQGTSVE